MPTAALFAYLLNPGNPITEPNVQDALEASSKLGQRIEIVRASSEVEIDSAFNRIHEMRADAVLAQPDAFLVTKRLVGLAERYAIPTMYQVRDLVAAGGLVSYGPSFSDLYRQMGVYVGEIQNGAGFGPSGFPLSSDMISLPDGYWGTQGDRFGVQRGKGARS